MTILDLIVFSVSLLMALFGFIWVAVKLGKTTSSKDTTGSAMENMLNGAAKGGAEHIFDDKFREELRNRGRLHFEKIIGENAMFLQQDLRLTTSQLNDYMKQEITRTL